MARDSIYSGNLAVLLAVIFFLGLASDMFAAGTSDFTRSIFRTSAWLLILTITFCSLSLATLVIGETISRIPSARKVLEILSGVAYALFVCQLILLLAFTFNVLINMMRIIG